MGKMDTVNEKSSELISELFSYNVAVMSDDGITVGVG